MSLLADINNLRNVNWGSKYTWGVKFTGPLLTDIPGSPFDDWFPASDINVEEAGIDSYSFEGYDRTYEVPLNSIQPNLNITFYDNEDLVLFKWLREWVNIKIHNKHLSSPHVSTLDKCVKTLQFAKYNKQGIQIEINSLIVFPKLTLAWDGNSQPDAQQYSVPFVIVGSYNPPE